MLPSEGSPELIYPRSSVDDNTMKAIQTIVFEMEQNEEMKYTRAFIVPCKSPHHFNKSMLLTPGQFQPCKFAMLSVNVGNMVCNYVGNEGACDHSLLTMLYETHTSVILACSIISYIIIIVNCTSYT